MTIKLTDAAKFYKELPHQTKAFEFLQTRLSQQTLEEFGKLYRTEQTSKRTIEVHPASQAGLVDKVVRRLLALKIDLYTGGSKGYGFSVVGIEGVDTQLNQHDDLPDRWNDICFGVKAWSNYSKLEIIGPFACTTEPGKYYTQNPLNKRGAAFAKTDTKHDGVWQLGWHKDQKDCLIQTGNVITVVRDENKNGQRNRGEYEDSGWFGINFHHTKGNYNPQSVGRWSAGCLVVPNPQQHKAIVDAFKASGQNKCSYVLLDGHKV